MKLTWHHGFLDPRDGAVEVDGTRESIAAAVDAALPRLAPVRPDWLTFVPLGDGVRTQVNVHGFGPFGVLHRDVGSTPAAGIE